MASECDPIPIIYIRRVCDLSSATIGCILSAIHLFVLLYIRHERKGRKLDYLLIMSGLCILTLLVLASGGLLDLCILPRTTTLLFYRKRIWLFALNSLYCTYGYIVLVLCIDRFIALHSPRRYIVTFSHLKARALFTLTSLFIGWLTCAKWFHFEQFAPSQTLAANESDIYNEPAWFTAVNAVSCLGQYFIPGILMLAISVKNMHKVRHEIALNSINGARLSSTLKLKSQETMVKICILLAVFYCVFNWPDGIGDYVYSDERNQSTNYGIAQIVMNISQAFYLIMNMFIFAYSSRLYRRTLNYILQWPFVSIMRCCGINYRDNGPLITAAMPPSESKTLEKTVVDLFTILYDYSRAAPHEIP